MMLNKVKMFVYGFVSCIIVFSIPTVNASVEEYILQRANFNIIVDGKEYKDNKLPILIKEGNTYIPLKNFCDIVGMNIQWNDQLKRVEISRVENKIVNINNNINIKNLNELIGKEIYIDDKEIIFTEDKETSALYIEVNGIKYIHEAFVFQSIASTKKVYQFRRNELTSENFEIRNDLYLHEIINNQIVIENIPTVIYQGIEFIDYEFYLNHFTSL